jgi:hypothetical protein
VAKGLTIWTRSWKEADLKFGINQICIDPLQDEGIYTPVVKFKILLPQSPECWDYRYDMHHYVCLSDNFLNFYFKINIH